MKRLFALAAAVFLSWMLIGPAGAASGGNASSQAPQQQKQGQNSKNNQKKKSKGEDRLWREKAKQDVAKQKEQRRQLIESGGK